MRRIAALIGRLGRWLGRFNILVVVAVGLFLGLLGGLGAWGGFNVVAGAVSSNTYCMSCHEMATPALQYEHSLHYLNQFGVRAQCTDCHVPKPFIPHVIDMVLGLRDVWGHMTGIIDTPAKFAAHKAVMQQYVWKEMTDDDSMGCRSCHAFEAMDFAAQPAAASMAMHPAMKAGATCISCHRGVVHSLSVALIEPSAPAAPGAIQILSPAQLLPEPPTTSALPSAAPSPALTPIAVPPGTVTSAAPSKTGPSPSTATASDEDTATLYTSHCSQCHALPAPDSQTATDWPGLVASMQARASLSDQQAADIVEYLKARSKTAGSQNGAPAASSSGTNG